MKNKTNKVIDVVAEIVLLVGSFLFFAVSAGIAVDGFHMDNKWMLVISFIFFCVFLLFTLELFKAILGDR
jgi:hypothetical protein